jgi:protein-tyrosine phosphatase
VKVLWNPTDDDFEPKPAALFRRGVDFVLEAFEESDAKVFIHCAAGIHRAPMMALAVLGARGWKLDDARELIEDKRPVADFAEVYVESVRNFLDGAGFSGL